MKNSETKFIKKLDKYIVFESNGKVRKFKQIIEISEFYHIGNKRVLEILHKNKPDFIQIDYIA